jgi:hypothetical protein
MNRMAGRSKRTVESQLNTWLASERARRRTKQALFGSILLTLVLYFIPFGRFLSYPLILLSTLVHELGHGLAALVVGGDFKSLRIFADASGVAQSGGVGGGVSRALVSAGGLVGPAILAGMAFIAARRATLARWFLGLLGAAFLLVLALFVRNTFGMVFTGVVGTALVLVAWRGSQTTVQLTLVFLAVQMALSVFSRGDYLFMEQAHTGAGLMPSDVAHMAEALGGPYWVWGAACGLFSVLVVLGGIWLFLRSTQRTALP